jgi:hypothetical protein
VWWRRVGLAHGAGEGDVLVGRRWPDVIEDRSVASFVQTRAFLD